MSQGVLPEEWKQTNVSPLYKKSSPHSAANYRPINLASVPAKVCESMIKDKIMEHLESNDLLKNSQHGFRPNRSVVSGMLDYWNEITTANEDGVPYDDIMTDFCRAFDLVRFSQCLAKVYSHGIRGKVHGWIKNWMNG